MCRGGGGGVFLTLCVCAGVGVGGYILPEASTFPFSLFLSINLLKMEYALKRCLRSVSSLFFPRFSNLTGNLVLILCPCVPEAPSPCGPILSVMFQYDRHTVRSTQ